MKLFIMCALMCLTACGAPDTGSSTTTYGTTNTSDNVAPGESYNPPHEDSDSQHCGEWHWVTVWEDGQPTMELQPIICVSGPNFNTGDPAPKVVDPNPWEMNGLNGKVTVKNKMSQ